MAELFVMKQDDTLPELEVTLIDDVDTGAPANLSTASEVKLFMYSLIAGTKIDGAAMQVQSPATSGVVTYAWKIDGTDTDIADDFDAEVEVTYSSGRKQTFPPGGYFRIRIVADLGGE